MGKQAVSFLIVLLFKVTDKQWVLLSANNLDKCSEFY